MRNFADGDVENGILLRDERGENKEERSDERIIEEFRELWEEYGTIGDDFIEVANAADRNGGFSQKEVAQIEILEEKLRNAMNRVHLLAEEAHYA